MTLVTGGGQVVQACPTIARRSIDEGALLVDVREPAESAQLVFDLPEVVFVPLSELAQRFAELPRDREILLACQSGPKALDAARFLSGQGFTRLAVLEGGLFKWAGRGLPIKAGSAAADPARQAGG